MKMVTQLFVTAAMLATGAGSAHAAAILGNGTPISHAALTGGTVVDFESADGSYTSYAKPGVTINGGIRATGAYSSNYNTYGKSIENNAGATSTLFFDFSQAVSAFAFNFGASDVTWTLTAFSGATALESLSIQPTSSGNNKAYFGLSGANITSAKLTHSGGDYILLDNLTFNATAVPEPATWGMMIIGFGAIGTAMRRRRAGQPATA